MIKVFIVGVIITGSVLLGQNASGQVRYSNPILHADYSDPDVIRVGDDYWMTSSSFNCVPGLQILHSTDLIHWTIVGAALPRLTPTECFDHPAHGNGVWAPSIRYHAGRYYIFWGDPDHGIYFVSTDNPRGRWTDPHLVIPGKGLIDPCPFWDEDGKLYLVHAWAGSRAGFKSILTVCELSPDCREKIGQNVLVFDGNKNGNKTVEGPKFYKRHGYYYIFAPAGGVKDGWQLVLRSRNIYGPYEWKKVLHQGNTDIHGPHQGGWVEDIEGNSWFLHFEDRYAYGRVVHLQPMKWTPDDWCTIGFDRNGDGIGEPVSKHKAPASTSATSTASSSATTSSSSSSSTTSSSATPNSSAFARADALSTAVDFSTESIPLNWQWHANPQGSWAMTCPSEKLLHLNCINNPEGWRNLWDTPNLLLRKISGPSDTLTALVSFYPSYDGDRAGIVVMGEDYALLGFEYRDGIIHLTLNSCFDAFKESSTEVVSEQIPIAPKPIQASSKNSNARPKKSSANKPISVDGSISAENSTSAEKPISADVLLSAQAPLCVEMFLRVTISPMESKALKAAKIPYGAMCTFSYSYDGKNFKTIGASFQAREGRWIGAKVGFFATAEIKKNDGGRLEVRNCR